MTSTPDAGGVHDYIRYRGNKCRCPICRTDHALHQRQAREVNRQQRLQAEAAGLTYHPINIKHGRNGFDFHQCRCDVCQAAQDDYNQRRSRRKTPPQGHATYGHEI